ncbi:Type IV pilus assembly PilZ [Bradyrhizobium sp. STM 3843]|uniref:PilZ domain-containing protein n=1 Tax=Bradyrhizobium sp. STM 3843 TaxID=551947 RepID=UPI000240324B|nr:PilZ domain-containing protein [Bradyrhizobium sp. STM 3843]CCE10077.1 Type IV pilus assembly PilZ [Bradyrhizobium sp. STM 3843]
MEDRRREARHRVYYGGVLTFNARCSTLACVVRNFNNRGAKVEFDGTALLPDRIDVTIERRGLSRLARLVWRDHAAAGLAFVDEQDSDVIPLEWARVLRERERANRKLKSRVEQLLSER